MNSWKIEYYTTLSGRSPVKEFIDNLAKKSETRFYNALELLSEFGPRLGLPHVRKITRTPLWELRVLGEQSLRFFYVAKVGQAILLLHGFVKKEQKTPQKEIKTAIERLKNYQLTNIAKK